MGAFILKNSLCMGADSQGRRGDQTQTCRSGDTFLCKRNKVHRVADWVIQLSTVWVKTVNPALPLLCLKAIYIFFINNLCYWRQSWVKSLGLKSSRNISQTRLLGRTSVLVEINAEKMERLLETGQICLSDVHCLDEESRQCMKGLCLKTCLKRK